MTIPSFVLEFQVFCDINCMKSEKHRIGTETGGAIKPLNPSHGKFVVSTFKQVGFKFKILTT